MAQARPRPGVAMAIAGGIATVMASMPLSADDTPMAHQRHAGGQPAPIHITMDALHAHGGTPPGWRFSLPPGDAAEGRKVFVAMECYGCHEVKGEELPPTTKAPRGKGPEMTAMGGHHPAEYFAESIMHPNRVIVEGEGYVGPDGLSTMPSYADTMTVQQLVDVVAYLRSLRAEEGTHHHHGAGGH